MTPARLIRIVRQRLRSVLGWRAQDEALDAELAFHLEQSIREKSADGLAPEAARQAALREFGSIALVKDQSRDSRGLGWLRDLAQDVGYAWRGFRRAPGVGLVTMASLGLGIGASAAVIGSIRSVLWNPLPFADADQLIVVRTTPPGEPSQVQGVSLSEYAAWKEQNRTLDAIGMSLSSPRELGVEPGGPYGERLSSQAFTPGLFTILGVQPARGRLFDDAPSPSSPGARVMVISHRLWQRRYDGTPHIIGRSVPADGGPRTIIGVMPPGFRYQDDDVEFWVPLTPEPAAGHDVNIGRPFAVTARLKPGVTPAEAEADLADITDDLARGLPERFRGRGVRVVSLRDAMFGWTRPVLYTLLTAVALLLTIACANVAGLLLARGTTRRRELWVRLSLGAGRGRIVRQLLAESVFTAAGGGVVGLGVAFVGLRLLVASMGPPPGAPRVGQLPFEPWLAVLILGVSIAAGLVIGTVPALASVRRASLVVAGGTLAPTAGDERGTRLRSMLVTAELALAAVLLVAAGLLVNSLMRLVHRDLNFEPDGLASFKYVVAREDFATHVGFDGVLPVFELTTVPAEAIARVHERLQAVPGVESVGGMTYQPVNSFIIPRFSARPLAADGDAGRRRDPQVVAGFLVTPDFFRTMRTPVLKGREVVEADGWSSPPVVVVNRAAERLFFPGGNALGRRLVVELAPGAPAREIVGVVADVPIRRRVLDPEPVIYLPSRQMPVLFRGGGPNFFGEMTFVVRYSGDLDAVLAAARQAVADVDPVRPIVDVGVVTRALNARLPELANYVGAVSGFGVIALLLAAIGVYGIMAFTVAARTRELGIRRALGAGSASVAIAIGRRACVLVLAGLGGGLVIAAALAGLVESQLIGIAPTDPVTFTAAAMLLAAVALLACVPATRRAIAIDPAHVLRSE